MKDIALPSLRRKILRSFLVVILLYGVFGLLLVSGVMISSGTTPKLLHVNYDSIASGIQMRKAITALQHPEDVEPGATTNWTKRFEDSLAFEEGNVTEPGESEIARELRSNWDAIKRAQEPISPQRFRAIDALLDRLVQVNEGGMFRLAEDNERMSQHVLVGAIIYFFISLLFVLFSADNLAERLSRPIKSIAEALRQTPIFGRRLKLPEPRSLELLILTNELTKLWNRVSESEKVNVREILQQKNKLTTVLESVEDALLVLDGEGKISHCNGCMLSLLELPLEQAIGHSWEDLSIAGENYLKLRAILSVSMPNSQELELTLKGVRRQYSARSKEILDSERKTVSTLYLLHDITEKRQREKFRAEFIDLLSHEIKTPLQSLGTACEFLKGERDHLSENVRLMVDTICEDTDRIRAVANEFVQVTQSQSKILKLKLQMTPINQTLPEWMKPFRIVAKDRNVGLKFEQHGSEAIWANIDSVKFPWVISNLLSNAIRFSPPGGEVVVVLTDRNGAVEIQVLDEGPGVSEEDERKLFGPFFQSSMATSSGLKGLFGIGLTIAKEVVEAHDGRIEYHTRKPKGAEFRIILPFPPLNYS